MTDVNQARFTIDGSAAEDPSTGDRKYIATWSQTLDCTLEQSPSEALLVKYEVFSVTDTDSPLASYDAPALTWVASGLYYQQLTNSNGTAQIIMPATGTSSFLIRCTATMDDGADVFERLVSLPASTSPVIRKTIPAETLEYYARGWSDEQNKMVDAIAAGITDFGSAGTYQAAWVTDAGGATIDVAAGEGYLRTTNSVTGTMVAVTWLALSGSAIPADTTRYVGIEYNSGSPQAVVRTTNNFNGNDDFLLAIVYNDSGTLHIHEPEQATMDGLHGTYDRFYQTEPLTRDKRAGGLIVGDTGTRNVSLTAGGLYDGLSRFAIGAIDTSGADTFDYYYRDGGGGWTKVAAQSQYSSTQYDDNSGALQPLTAGNYGITWWYLESDGHLVGLYGWGDYATLSSAEDATPPSSVPARITAHGLLVGRTIVLQAAAAATEVESVWDQSFGLTAVTSHLSLTDIGTNTHVQIDAHIASTANPHVVTLDQAYDGAGGGAGRDVAVDGLPIRFLGTDVATGLLQVVQTPTVGTQSIVCSLQAQGVNWSGPRSAVLELISDHDNAPMIVTNDGVGDIFELARDGSVTLGGVSSKYIQTANTLTSGILSNVVCTPAAGSTAIICQLEAQGVNWNAGARVLNIISDHANAIPIAINDGAADVITLYRSGNISMTGNIGMGTGGQVFHDVLTGAFVPALAAQTNESMALLTGSTANTVLVTEYANLGSDHHGPVETDPTISIFSTLDPATDFGEHCDWSYNRLACNIMETDRATFDFGITAVSAFAGATGGNRDGGDIVLTGGTAAAGGVSGMVKVGSGSPGTITPAVGALYVTNSFEVDGVSHYGGTATHGASVVIGSGFSLYLGDSNECRMLYSTAQTPDSMVLGLPSASKGLVVCDIGDAALDFAKALQTDPTIFMQSSLAPTTDTGENVGLAYSGLTCGTMSTDRATWDFTITGANANAGATGGNRDAGDVILVGGTNAAGGVAGMVKVGAGSPSTITPTVGSAFVTTDLEVGNDIVGSGNLTMTAVNAHILATAITDETTPILSIKQTPSVATTNTMVRITADGGTNWTGASRVLEIISDDNSCVPLTVNNGSSDVAIINRSGTCYLSGNLEITGGGTIRTSANGSLTFAPHGTGIIHADSDIELDGDNGSIQTRGSITEEVTIAVGQGAGGVVTAGNLVPGNSYIKEILTYVTQAPGGGATTLDVGRTNGGNLDEAADGTAVALGTTTMANDDGDGNTTFPVWEAGDDTLTLTTDANVTVSDMKVRITVYYEKYTAHTG